MTGVQTCALPISGQHKIAQALTYEVIWKRLFMEIAQLVEEREDS